MMKRFQALFFMLFVLPYLCAAYHGPGGPSGTEERILEVLFPDGGMILEGMLSYEFEGQWYFPLEELTHALGFSIRVSPALRLASGNVLQDTRIFRLDLKDCRVDYEQHTENLALKGQDCKGVLALEQDLYVAQSLFEKWFPLEIRIDLFRQRMTVYPKEKFPYQLRKEREQIAEATLGQNFAYNPGFSIEPLKSHLFEGPFIDEQLNFSKQFSPYNPHLALNQSTGVTHEFLSLDTKALFFGNLPGPQTWSLRFSKKDPDGKLLGPLAVKEIQFFDIVMPQAPLISFGQTSKGILVSSLSFQYSPYFGQHEIQGDLFPGWEIELYQNDILVGRQIADDTKRYHFLDLNLNYGRNDFRLLFYGPQGQRKEEYQSYPVDAEWVKPKGFDYQIAASYLEKKPLLHLLVDQGLGDRASLKGGFTRTKSGQNPTPLEYGFLSLGGFSKNIVLAGTGVFSQTQGKALQFETKMPLWRASLGAKYTKLWSFRSEIFNRDIGILMTSQFQGIFSHIIFQDPSVALNWEIFRNDFEDHSAQSILDQRASVRLGRFLLTHEFRVQMENLSALNGRFDLHYIPDTTVYRMGVDYSLHTFSGLELEIQKNISDKISFSTKLHVQPTTKSAQLTATMTRKFKAFDFGVNGDVTNSYEYSLGTFLNFSLSVDPHSGYVYIDALPQADQGAASAFVFIDQNFNGEFDEGEKPLSGVGFIVNQRELPWVSDKSGNAYIPHLVAYVPSDIGLSLRTIENPLLEAVKKGVRVVPRPGKTHRILFPVIPVGEVDGTLEVRGGRFQGLQKGIGVWIVDSETGNKKAEGETDSDGFFWIHSIRPGTYEVKVDPEFLKKSGYRSDPEKRILVISPEGSIEILQNFRLLRR